MIRTPLPLDITPARINGVTAAKAMPIEPGATYVFDLGYYAYAWWAALDDAGCRLVTRLKSNPPPAGSETRAVPTEAPQILSDQIGCPPARRARARHNPMRQAVREIKLRSESGKLLRILTNDLDAPAAEIAALYKRRWAIELFVRWVKQTLKLRQASTTMPGACTSSPR